MKALNQIIAGTIIALSAGCSTVQPPSKPKAELDVISSSDLSDCRYEASHYLNLYKYHGKSVPFKVIDRECADAINAFIISRRGRYVLFNNGEDVYRVGEEL